MNISFKRNIFANYMVFENERGFSENSFEAKMLQKNDLGPLLNFGYEIMDGEKNLLFDISGMQAFSKIYEVGRMKFEDIFKMIMSLRKMMETLKEYLLDVNNIVLKKECIFIDSEEEEYRFCYHPCYNGDVETELRELLEFVLSVVDYDDSRAVKASYDLFGIAQRDNFIMDDLVLCLNSEKEAPVQIEDALSDEENKEEPFSPYKKYKEASGRPEVERVQENFADEEELRSKPAGFLTRFRRYLKGRTLTDIVEDIDNGELRSKIREAKKEEDYKRGSMYNPELPGFEIPSLGSMKIGEYDDNLTTVLTPDMAAGRKLVGINRCRGQVVELNSFPFTLGKSSEQADLVLNDSTVSRMHARLYHEDDMYYIEDLNSRNGTYINEQEAESYTRYSIMPGDVIRLAREEFCFR